MNSRQPTGTLRRLAFRIGRAIMSIIPGGTMAAFGTTTGTITSILVVNLDRQPTRWRRVLRELSRFRTSDGAPLTSIVRRLSAVDARDGRAVAATGDVDPTYRIGDQLYVQPDARLEECFGVDAPIRMTRQEVAVARSHVEAWKTVATGPDNFVLVLEDDIWFRRGAATAIDSGWQAALERCRREGGPRLLYLSYADALGAAERDDACDAIFRPRRGLWFLSGYVLSRQGAAALLRAMPVVGPVDTWMNYRFQELGALALCSPAILQRQDGPSDNSYSILPYLARAGIVDAGSGPMPPDHARGGPVLAWTAGGGREGLAMALSMLGLRVRAFDGDEKAIQPGELANILEVFDAVVDPPLTARALSAAIARRDSRFLLEPNAALWSETDLGLPSSRTAALSHAQPEANSWEPLCALLGLPEPVQAFPLGAPAELRVFRDDRPDVARLYAAPLRRRNYRLDDSPWVLPPGSWQSRIPIHQSVSLGGERLVHAAMTVASDAFPALVETFPGNLASFTKEGLTYHNDGAHLVISQTSHSHRPYRSGAFGSVRSFEHGRFEAEIRPASGPGLVTGFFLHRDAPRQEIDVELAGNDPRGMLANVYFNPGDEGTTLGYGYRGSPCRIDLGFDATLDFHLYAIDWQPGCIAWLVDGRVVHERVGWDPTPLPHLPMRLHANLWAPRSEELAGSIDNNALPSTATFRNVSVRGASTRSSFRRGISASCGATASTSARTPESRQSR
jgi:GR25 family glycosyltransferase involved in LPS biosynthesis